MLDEPSPSEVGQMGRGAAGFVVLVLFAACSPAQRIAVRAPTAVEIRALEQAIKPLLAVLRADFAPALRDCPIGLAIIRSPAINAGTRLGEAGGCPPFTLAITEGMLRRIPLDMLRAVLAHELGHVQLGHLEARRQRGSPPAILRPLTAAFGRREEEEADRFAVELLRRLEPRQPDACVAFVYVLALLAEQPPGTGWLSTHPSPDGRAEAALAGCNRR